MKSLLAAATILAATLGLGQGAAQTGASSPGNIGATSPLGADFGQTLGNSRISAPSQGGINATSPLGADFGQSLVIIPKPLRHRLPTRPSPGRARAEALARSLSRHSTPAD